LGAPPLAWFPAIGKLLRRFHSQAPVWAKLVVFLLPRCNDNSCFTQGVEELSSQALTSKLVVKAFHKTVLPRTSRLDIKRFNRFLCQPLLDRLRHKFGTVVAPDMTGCSVTINQLSQQLQDFARSNVASRMELIHFTSVFIHHSQGPKASSFHRGVVDEVPRPDVTSIFGLRWVKPGAGSSATLFLFGRRNLKALLATHLANSLVTHSQASIANQSTNFVRSKLRMLQTQIHNRSVSFLLL